MKVEDLDQWFPPNGPCAVCGDEIVGARHRRIDSVAGSVLAGDSVLAVATAYDLDPDAVQAAVEWSTWSESKAGVRELRRLRRSQKTKEAHE